MNAGKLRLWALFIVFNLVGFAALGITHLKGLTTLVVARDSSYICVTIFGLFLVSLVLCYRRVVQLNREFDDLDTGKSDLLATYQEIGKNNPSDATEWLKTKLGSALTWINCVLYLLPALGLLGTVVGIAMGLEGSVLTNATEITQVIDKLFFQVVNGLCVAFYTTIVGLVFNIWLYMNLLLLEKESLQLMERIFSSASAQGASATLTPAPATSKK